MTESISISNFGPISHIEIPEIRPLTVFIGKSASGKSTIMKVTALMRYLFKMVNIRSYFHHSGINRSPFRIEPRKLMEENGLAGMIRPDTRITYIVRSDSGNAYEVKLGGGKIGKLPDVAKSDLIFQKGVFVSENRNAISSWLGSGANRHGFKLGYYFGETTELFMEASDAMEEMELPFVGMTFKQVKLKNGLKQYRLSDNSRSDVSFRLRDASSGIKSTTPLALIMEYMAGKFDFTSAFNRSVLSYLYQQDRLNDFKPVAGLDGFRRRVDIHVEEPELSLDPAAQTRLLLFLTDLMIHRHNPDRTITLMFATHSPYLVNFLNLLMAMWESDTSQGTPPCAIDVYLTDPNGTMRSMTVTDEKGRKVVDADYLASEIEDIYTSYSSLRRP